jgi:pimeloyl-ACP methyl ester carboxylesterase
MGLLMTGPMRRRLPALAVALGLAACATVTGDRLTLPDGSDALQWGDGPYGLVLVHEEGADAASWEPQAVAFAEEGMTVLAVEVSEREAIAAAIRHLRDGVGLERVALLAAGSGSEAALAVGRDQPELVDQLIVISATSQDVAELGPFPKLFVASEGEIAAAQIQAMAEQAPGDWNDVFLAEGATSGQAMFDGEGGAATLDAVLQRLAERR